jgi:hypothetical protein
MVSFGWQNVAPDGFYVICCIGGSAGKGNRPAAMFLRGIVSAVGIGAAVNAEERKEVGSQPKVTVGPFFYPFGFTISSKGANPFIVTNAMLLA